MGFGEGPIRNHVRIHLARTRSHPDSDAGGGQAGQAKGVHWASAAMKKADGKARAVHSPNSYVRCAVKGVGEMRRGIRMWVIMR